MTATSMTLQYLCYIFCACISYIHSKEISKCSENSLQKEGDECLGKLIEFEALEECDENSFQDEDDACLGELIPIDDVEVQLGISQY